MLKNRGGTIGLLLALFIPIIFMITFMLSFGDYFDTDPAAEKAHRAQQALYGKIGLY